MTVQGSVHTALNAMLGIMSIITNALKGRIRQLPNAKFMKHRRMPAKHAQQATFSLMREEPVSLR